MNQMLQSFRVASAAGKWMRYLSVAQTLAAVLSIAAMVFGVVSTVRNVKQA